MDRTAYTDTTSVRQSFSPSAPATSRLILLPGSEVLKPIPLTKEDVNSYSLRDSAMALVENQLNVNLSNTPPLSIQRANEIVERTLQQFYGWIEHYRREIMIAMLSCTPKALQHLKIDVEIATINTTIKLLQEYKTLLTFAAGIKVQSTKSWLASQDKCLRDEQFFKDILVGREDLPENYENDDNDDDEDSTYLHRVSIWSVLSETLRSAGPQRCNESIVVRGLPVLIPPVDMQYVHGHKLLLASGTNIHFKKYQFDYKYSWGGASHNQPLLEWHIVTYNLVVYTTMLAFAEYRRLTCPPSRASTSSPIQPQRHFVAKYEFELGSTGLACGDSINFLKWFGKSVVADGCDSLYGVGKTTNTVAPSEFTDLNRGGGGGGGQEKDANNVMLREKCITHMLHGIILLDVDPFTSRSASSAKQTKEIIYSHCDCALDAIKYIRSLFKEALLLVKVLVDTGCLDKIDKDDFTINPNASPKQTHVFEGEGLEGKGGHAQERELLINFLGVGLVSMSEILCSLNTHHLMYFAGLIEAVSVCLDLDRVRMEALKYLATPPSASDLSQTTTPQLKKSLLQWAYFYAVLSTFMANNKNVLEMETYHCITKVQETFFDVIYPIVSKDVRGLPDKTFFLKQQQQQQQQNAPTTEPTTTIRHSTTKSGIDAFGDVLLDEIKEWRQNITDVLRSNESERDTSSTFIVQQHHHHHGSNASTNKVLTNDDLDLLRRWISPLPGKQYGYCMKFGALLDYGRVFINYMNCLLVQTLATQEAFVKNDTSGDSNIIDVGALYYYNPQTFPTSVCIDLMLKETQVWNSQPPNIRMAVVDSISQVQLNWFMNMMMCVKNLVITHQKLQHINLPTKTRTLPRTFQMRCPHEFLSCKSLDISLDQQQQYYNDTFINLLRILSRSPPQPPIITRLTTIPIPTPTITPITTMLLQSPFHLWNERLYNVLLYLTGKVSLMVQSQVIPMTVYNLLSAEEIEQDIVRVCVNYYMIHGGAIGLQTHLHGIRTERDDSIGYVDKYKVLLQNEIESLPSSLKEKALVILFDVMSWTPDGNHNIRKL